MEPVEPSSKDLHPRNGARFVFDRGDDGGGDGPPRYAVAIYLPAGERLDGELAWIEGKATLELQGESERHAWARDEALKLARVLRRDPKRHMVRWRG